MKFGFSFCIRILYLLVFIISMHAIEQEFVSTDIGKAALLVCTVLLANGWLDHFERLTINDS